MTVKGIDMQIMVQRATDFMKENATALKKNELMQDFQAVQSKLIAKEQQGQVARMENKESIKQVKEEKQEKNNAGESFAQRGAIAREELSGESESRQEEETGTVSATKIDIRI